MSGYDEEKRYAVVAETRRRWSAAEKEAILADTVEGSVSAAARKHGVAASLVFRWRRRQQSGGGQKSERQTAAAFVPVALPAPSTFAPRADRGLIEIELAGGRRIRVTGPVEAEALRQVIAVVEGR